MKKKIFTALATILLVLFCLPVAASAEMLDKDADPPVVASSGSFDSTYQTRMEFSFSGGTLTGAKWTRTQGYVGYALNGTCKEGEAVSLSLTGTQSPVPDTNAKAVLVFNSMNMKLTFRDGNQKVIGEEQKYSSGNVKSSPLSHQLGASVPAGTKTVDITGSFNCRWATSVVAEEMVAVTVKLIVEEEPGAALAVAPAPTPTPEPSPKQEDPQPSSSSVPEQASTSEPKDEEPGDGSGPWEHAGPLATAVISIIAAIAAVLGGAGGSAAATAAGAVGGATGIEGGTADGRDPAYERAKVPDYPEFVVGQEGELITKRPDGIIEASFPNGDVAIHFPNGTAQVKSPDGTTWEEWPDGTVSTTDNGQFIVKEPDGTMTVREPNGEETVYKPDGTSIHTNSKGWKATKNAEGEIVSAERDGFVVTRHPEDPDVKIMTSPYGGSIVIREKAKTETFRNTDGRLEQRTVYEPVHEGEIRTENKIFKYRPDGSMEGQGDDGSTYTEDKDGNMKYRGADGTTCEKYANGSINASSPDGTNLKYNSETGEIDYKFSDGSYIKGNERTGELDAKMADGSYWQRDAKGNGDFYNTKEGTKGVSREDGYFKIEVKGGSFIQNADGTMELQAEDGTSLIQRADGTQYVRKPDGTEITPDQS